MQDIPVEKLGLSVRSSNCLRRAGIFFLSQLISLTEEDLREMRNMGAKSATEVLEFQQKINGQLNTYTIDLESCSYEKICDEEELMIHKAFPQILGRPIKEIRFRDSFGLLLPDIDINDLKLSVRTTNAMNNNNITSLKQIANKTYSFVSEMKNMGAKSVNEIILYLKENAEVIIEGEERRDIADDFYKFIENKCLEEKDEFPMHIFARAIRQKLYENENVYRYMEGDFENIVKTPEFIEKIFLTDEMLRNIQEYFLGIIWNEKEVEMSSLRNSIPSILLYRDISKKAINNLLELRKIELYHGMYRVRLQYLNEWIDTLKDSHREAMLLRLQNKTLEECGRILGLTRERVRQLINKAMRSKPTLREDDYAYWYREYVLDFEAMNMIFNVDETTYIYYTIAYKQGIKPLEEMYEDSNLTLDMHSNIHKYINRNSILICGEYVPCKRDLLCRKLAQVLCSEEEMSFEEFYDYYIEILSENGLEENEKLLFPSERAFEARLQDSQYVLMKYGRKFRYYPINEYDIVDFVSNLHLEQFKDVEISTLKLYNEYPELMKEFNISDEYELHNLLKKTEKIWNEDEKYDVVITRMPFLSFGLVDRAKQTEELLYIVAPVSLEEFAEFYEMEYGVLKQTVMANMTQYISTYYHEGYYSINQPQLSNEEFDYLEKELVEEFYFIDDVKLIYVNKYGNANIDCMNPRTFKELGFKVYRGYLIKSTYLSADEYFTKEFTKNKLLDMNNYDSRLAYIQSSYQALDNLKTNYDLIEYDEKKYISYTHFSSVAENITKDTFKEYVEEAIAIAGDEEFFTIKSLKKKGFDSELHKLGFGDWFNTSLLKNSKRIKYVRTGNGVIFSKQKSQITTVDFIRYIMNDIRKMDINEFIDYIEDIYGISYAKDKLVLFIKDSEMYYDSTMEKIYATKEEFYDDF